MTDTSAPPLSKAFMEGLAVPKVLASALRPPLRVAGAGHGEPVVVIPGMMSGDNSTSYLRRSLSASGFDARPSGLVFNTGITPRRVECMQDHVRAIASETGQPVTIIGWSLGGLYARLLAHRSHGEIARVITLGSPFSGDPHGNNAWRLYELINRHAVTESPFPEDISVKPPVETIAVWSPNDGVVSAASSRGLPAESDRQVELPASHFELATSAPAVRSIIALLHGLVKQAG